MEGSARTSPWGHRRWLAWGSHLGIHESARHKARSSHMYIFEQCEGVVFRCCRGSPRDLWWLPDTSAAICFTMTLIFTFTFCFQSVFESTARWRTSPVGRERSSAIVAGPKPWSLFLCKGILFSHHHREHKRGDVRVSGRQNSERGYPGSTGLRQGKRKVFIKIHTTSPLIQVSQTVSTIKGLQPRGFSLWSFTQRQRNPLIYRNPISLRDFQIPISTTHPSYFSLPSIW